MKTSPYLRVALITLVGLAVAAPAVANNRTYLRNICRIKGQEENTLSGFGLIVGLNGTGESDDEPTMRKLARAMELLGSPVSQTGRLDEEALKQLANVSNVSLVHVTATIPATGARRGDKIDCYASAINGSSLAGGRLAFAALKGPNTQDPRVYGLCQGALQLDDPDQPMVARIHGGCQIQQDVFTPFVQDGYVTLVLDANHADFHTADVIAHKIQEDYGESYIDDAGEDVETLIEQLVHAVDAANIRVKVPRQYALDPVGFIAGLLEIDIYDAEPEARVYINPRVGSIVISGDVEIGDVVVTHRNLVVDVAAETEFRAVDPGETNKAKLDRLIQALKQLQVPPGDVIEIVRGIDRLGKLHAKLIVE